MVNESKEGLEEEVLLDCAFMEEGNQGGELKTIFNVLQRDLIPLDANISQEVEVSHEIGPMVLIRVIASVVLHELALGI